MLRTRLFHQVDKNRFRRLLGAMLIAALTIPAVLASASPVQARTDQDFFVNPPSGSVWDATAAFLEQLGSRDSACKAFFKKENGEPSGHCDEDGDRGDNHLPVFLQSDKYDPTGRSSVASSIKKLKGNPYVTVGATPDGDFRPGDFPPGVQTSQMRFVLAQINNKSKGDLDPTGGSEGNVFIFRNEFNPNLAIEYFNKPSGATNPIATDASHFAYESKCTGAFSGDSYISDLKTTGDIPTSNAEDKEELEQYLEENEIRAHICDENLNFFAQAMQNALQSVADFFGGLIDSLSNALGDIIDVGTIAQVPGLTNAWKTIRDFVNVIFILILSAIAFSTIIRLDSEKYGVRALLPRLVFAVIAVNFSLLMVQVLTNFAFILSQPFKETAFALITNPPANGSLIEPSAGIGEAAMAILVLIVVIIAMIVLLAFFVVRILMIWLLAALSPFVFLFMILPVTRSLASSWWKNAVKWIFMAPIAFVILFIAAEVVSGGRQTAQSTQDPGFILKIGFFAGALIAAVIIPLKLGGEVMGRAVGGAQKAGRFGRKAAGATASRLPGARTAAAYMEQRKANQEQGARLRATAIQGGISRGLSRVPGGRAGAAALTGGRAGMIGAQQAALESKYAKDIQDMGLNATSQRMVASGDVRGLRRAGLHQAANLARTGSGRRAAGKLLAQNGLLTAGYLESMPARRRREQIAAGNQALMRSVNPVLAAQNTRGNITDAAIDGIHNQVSSLEPGDTKEMYWTEMARSLHSANPQERRAAETAFHSVSSVNAADNINHQNRRNLISSDEEREAFVRGVSMHGNAAAQAALGQQLLENHNSGVGNGGVGG